MAELNIPICPVCGEQMVKAYKENESELTLHWSPDTGKLHWNKGGELSKGYESREEAVKDIDNIEYIGNQFSMFIRLGMAEEYGGFDKRKVTHHEYTVESPDHVSDCTCRYCHPECWMLDSRNIWVRKIGSIGDDVV